MKKVYKKMAPVQAKAPGKLILSGEHAVVYGHPALVMAVNRYVTATAISQSDSQITFLFPDLSKQSLTGPALIQLQQRIRRDYQGFLTNHLSIREVLQGPIELLQFALSLFFETMNLAPTGIQITLHADLPIGCGMGSSAAAILSTLTAAAHCLERMVAPELLFTLAHQAEKMQHGQSSGLDVRSSLHGGCLYFKEGQMLTRTPSSLPFYLINTGKPQTTTGESVAAASVYFKKTKIGEDFAEVTHAMDHALQSNHQKDVMNAMRANHKLLNTIGVVPEKVQQMIAEIELAGGAAKISGAGAVAGDHAGMVLIIMEEENVLKKIARRYQQTLFPVQCEMRGVYTYDAV